VRFTTCRWFVIRVYHKGVEVWAESWRCRDGNHAHKKAAYLAMAAARDVVHPRDFDPRYVHWAVDGVGCGRPGATPEGATVAL
jgi:hypothetical protein